MYSSKDKKALLSEIVSRFKLAKEAEENNRKLGLEDLEFRAGNQWPSKTKEERNADGRPCLTINRIPQFIQQITNDQRQNRPAIRVSPVDDDADIETAKVIQGLIRHIEYSSDADVAYDRAFDGAVTHGRGFFRVITDYVSHDTFDQEIRIESIRDPFNVFFDPFSQRPDGSDSNYAYVVEDLSKEEYKTQYKDSELAKPEMDWGSIGNDIPDWVSEEGCRVAEYYYKKHKKQILVMTESGEILPKSDWEALPDQAKEIAPIAQERETLVPEVCWVKTNGYEVLDETVIPTKFIPVIPVYGNEMIVNGERILEGVIRNAKDSQRMYNYWASAETEAIALAPRAPFIAAEGQIEDYAHQWEESNRRNHAVLKYKPDSLNGTPLPPPQRQSFEPAVQAITQARMLASDDLKATTGIYDTALGNQGNETSGIAIQRRNMQSQTANFHFVDNLTRSLRHCGRIIVNMIPKIYDTERTARILGEDDEQRIVKLNAQFEDDESGQTHLYKMDTGKYDVTVDVGPSYATKRQEAVEAMLEIVRAYPQLAQYAGDLLVKNMDWPGAQDFAERLKKTIPPEMLETDEKVKIPPQVQQEMTQMQQMIEQLTTQLNQANEAIDKDKFKIESNERIKLRELETKVEIERANLALEAEKIGSNEAIELLKNEIAELKGYQLATQKRAARDESTGGQSPGQPTGGPAPGTPMGEPV